MKMTAYTCVTGGYDSIDGIVDSQFDKGDSSQCSYVIFTDQVDQPEERNGWLVLPCFYYPREAANDAQHAPPSGCHTPQRMSRWHKVNSHALFPGEMTVWFDGSQVPTSIFTLDAFQNMLAPQYSIATFRHPERECLYDELEACIRYQKDDPQEMRAQVARYAKAGYPENNGMVETACVVRAGDTSAAEFNRRWWQEIENHSVRDQLSFNYAAFVLGLPYGRVPGSRDSTEYFHFCPHKKAAPAVAVQAARTGGRVRQFVRRCLRRLGV